MEIHYVDRGTGPPLLLHTGAGGDHRLWELAGYVEGLAGFRLILLDQRGRGASGRPLEVADHALERFAGDVAAVLDDAGIDSAGFWGYSDGALVGTAFGASHSARLQALVGTGSLPFVDLADLPRPANAEEFIQEVVGRGGVVHSLERFMEREHDRFPEAIDRNVRETDPRMNALDDLAWLSWRGPKSVYPTFAAPVLMVTGEKEDVKHQTEESVGALPRGRVVRLEGVGHLGAFYRSDLALAHVLPFLREHLH